MKQGPVFVGLSGGVDSSVSAARLKDAGYRVVGVFIRTWAPEFLPCTIERDRLDAMRVAARLDIPFMTFDAEETYKKDVANYMIREYERGRTPNPDVMCNRFIKFGAFLTFAREHGASKIATGHYAQVREEGGRHLLFRGRDASKDQSYFLWTLNEQELSSTLFPVGDTEKTAVRAEAERYPLPTWDKSDSQGICFLGHVDMRDFLSRYIHAKPGDVLDDTGAKVGTHDGALFYTMGQRTGFLAGSAGPEGKPWYVTGKDMRENTITVAHEPVTSSGRTVVIRGINEIGGTFPPICEAQFRYREQPFPATIQREDNDCAMLTVLEPSVALPSLGQSAVLYDGDRCLGGGIIDEII